MKNPKQRALNAKMGKKLENAQNRISKTTKSGDEYFKRLHNSKEHKEWRASVDSKNNY